MDMRLRTGFLPLAAGLACFALFLAVMAPGVAMEDTGELVAAAGSLGVTHPPGYQWHTLLGRLFMLAPVGTPAFRVGLMGAAAGAAAAALVFSLTRLLAGTFPAVFACAVFALSRTFFWQAGLAEKYTLSLVLFAGAFHLLVRAGAAGGPRSLATAGVFLAGIALSHHWSALPLLIPIMVFLRPWTYDRARVLVLAFWFIFPSALRILLVPVLSSATPYLDWGDPDSFARLVEYLGAKAYRTNVISTFGIFGSLARFLRRLLVFPFEENPALVLCIPGFFLLARTQGRLFRVVLSMVLGVVLAGFLAGLPETVPEGERYYIPLVFLLSIAAGVGAASLGGAGKIVRTAIVLAAVWGAARSLKLADSSRSYFAADLCANLRASLPRGSAVVAYSYRWFAPIIHDRVINSEPIAVGFGPAMLGVINEPVLTGAVTAALGPLEPPVDRAAFLGRVKERLPGGLFHTYEQAPFVLPAEQGRWIGMLFGVSEGFAMEAAPLKLLARLRYRSFLRGRRGYELQTVEYVARIIETQVRIRPADPDAVRCARLAARLAPGRPGIMEALGLAFERSGDLSSAAEVYAFAARMVPGFMDPHLGFARMTAMTGQEDERFGALMRAVEAARPEDEGARIRAASLVAAGKPRAAVRELSAAVAAAFHMRGLLYLEQGQADAAARSFAFALEFDPGNPASLVGLGRIAAAEERWDRARDRFVRARRECEKKAAGGDPDERLNREAEEGSDAAVRAKLAAVRLKAVAAKVRSGEFAAGDLIILGDAALDLGRREWASACYRRAVESFPGSPEAWNRTGMMLAASGDWRGAARALRKALSTGGPDATVMVNLGRVYARMGRKKAAAKLAREAARIAPGEAEVGAFSRELAD